MALSNDYLWSWSRQQKWDRCRREFYLSVFGGWGGWNASADERTRLIYRLGKMTNLDLWAGLIVHQTIADLIRDVHWTDKAAEIDKARHEAMGRAVTALREGWRQSVRNEWELNPKWKVRLFEHHYSVPIDASVTDRIKAKVVNAVSAWFESGFLSRLLAGECTEVLAVEKLETVDIGGVKVCCAFDFHGRFQDGGPEEIWDWKTGASKDQDERQAQLYALATGKEASQVRVFLHYLQTNTTQEVTVTRFSIAETRAWLDRCAREQWDVVPKDRWATAKESDFPMTEQQWKCRRCFYHEVCHGTRQIEEAA